MVLTISNPEHRNALGPEIYAAGVEALQMLQLRKGGCDLLITDVILPPSPRITRPGRRPRCQRMPGRCQADISRRGEGATSGRGGGGRGRLRITSAPVERLADYIEAIGLVPAEDTEAYRYASLPLCVIDAVFSIGVKYETTEATVDRVCDRLGWPRLASSRAGRGTGPQGITDLLGAQINAPTRQAAIKSALLHLLSQDEKVAQPAA